MLKLIEWDTKLSQVHQVADFLLCRRISRIIISQEQTGLNLPQMHQWLATSMLVVMISRMCRITLRIVTLQAWEEEVRI